MSHAIAMAANANRYQTPFHLVAQAAPRKTPASTRRHRTPRCGPPPASSLGAACSASAASLAREASRSSTSMPNAASTQNITKMSRIAVLLSTNSSPSSAISRPATQPSSVERVIRRVIRAVIRIASVPTTATENRQPNGVRPNSHSPTAIIALPSGGCATYSPGEVRTCVLPLTSSELTFLG